MVKYTVSAPMFKEMILAAAKYLEQNKPTLNDLNVFPVPDGDTGTNMSMTIYSAAREVSALEDPTVGEIAAALSSGALKGARGNSGVILSQIFRGFALSMKKNKHELEAKDLAEALEAGVAAAYKAVMKPKEGTILTVARDMAAEAMAQAEKTNNVLVLLDAILAKGNETLLRTPEMLPVLAEAGVVDAGGAGLIAIYTGFKMALDGEEIASNLDFTLPPKQEVKTQAVGDEGIEFGYCTEFFIKHIDPSATEDDIEKFRNRISLIGDSVVVVGDLELVKVHVHTNSPGKALQYALRLGELSGVKIDNMREQHRELIIEFNNDEEQPQRELKEMAIAAVSAGDGLTGIFNDFGVESIITGGQSMNPSIEDIVKAIDAAGAKNVFVLPNNKNIILAAEQAAELAEANVVVIPTTTLPQGINAAISFDPNDTFESNAERLRQCIGELKSGQITYAVRDSMVHGQEVREGQILGIFEDDIVCFGDDVNEVAGELVGKMVTEDDSVITLYYGADVDEDYASQLKGSLEESYDFCDAELYSGGQPLYSYIISVE